MAAERLHAGRDARAVHDVRRRARAGPGRAAGVRRLGSEGRRGRLAVGRRARPAAQPPARGRRRGARRRVRRAAGRSSSPRAAEPQRDATRGGRSGNLFGGGVSERPKEHASKACVGKTTVGSNPTATATGPCSGGLRRSPRILSRSAHGTWQQGRGEGVGDEASVVLDRPVLFEDEQAVQLG